MKIKQLTTMNNGFFTALYTKDTSNPIFNYFSKEALDFNFFGRFGKKESSPLLDNIIEDGEISSTDMQAVSSYIYEMNKYKYSELFKVLDIIDEGGWDPTENYSLFRKTKDETTYGKTDTLEKQGSEAVASTGKDTETHTGTDTLAKSGKEKNTHDTITNETNDESSVFPFNAEETVGSDGSVKTSKDKSTNDTNTTDELEFTNRQDQQTKNLTDELTHGKTDTTTFTNRKDINTAGGVDTTEIETTEHGSMGVSSAIDQVLKNFNGFTQADFFEMLLSDWAQMLTIPIWGEE